MIRSSFSCIYYKTQQLNKKFELISFAFSLKQWFQTAIIQQGHQYMATWLHQRKIQKAIFTHNCMSIKYPSLLSMRTRPPWIDGLMFPMHSRVLCIIVQLLIWSWNLTELYTGLAQLVTITDQKGFVSLQLESVDVLSTPVAGWLELVIEFWFMLLKHLKVNSQSVFYSIVLRTIFNWGSKVIRGWFGLT